MLLKEGGNLGSASGRAKLKQPRERIGYRFRAASRSDIAVASLAERGSPAYRAKIARMTFTRWGLPMI